MLKMLGTTLQNYWEMTSPMSCGRLLDVTSAWQRDIAFFKQKTLRESAYRQ
jgi:hypothetical protein